ncbi:MAG TPA: DUF6285 domain-containing protein [Candidatus Binatia bacterium]|nr:DUF6285 domain-containing protein [Candidatus Binatia bacterium]
MHDRPTAHELLTALQRFLDEDVVPATEGRRQFLARVAANVARTVDRELASEEEQLRAEWRGLDALLGVEPEPATRADLRAAIARRTESLCARIRAGDADGDTPFRETLFAHLRATVRDKLLVANPAWLPRDGERPKRSPS